MICASREAVRADSSRVGRSWGGFGNPLRVPISIERRHRERRGPRRIGVVDAVLLRDQGLAEPRVQYRDLARRERTAKIRSCLVLGRHDARPRTGGGVRRGDHVEHDLKPLRRRRFRARRRVSAGGDPVIGMIVATIGDGRCGVDHMTSIASPARRGEKRLYVPLKADRRRQNAGSEAATGAARSETSAARSEATTGTSATDSDRAALACPRGSGDSRHTADSWRAPHRCSTRRVGPHPGRASVRARCRVAPGRGTAAAIGSAARQRGPSGRCCARGKHQGHDDRA